MTDIVERLLNPAGMEEGESISGVVARFRLDMREAANEIERLRSQVAGMVAVTNIPLDGPLMPASVSINEPLPMEET